MEEPKEEIDWNAMDADYLSDKKTMDNGAIRELEMTARDLHRFEEEYGKTYNGSSTNDMMIYRISHDKDEYAFSNSILVNFADQWYFEKNSDDLEYYYAVDSDDIDPDSKVFNKARAEMKDQYEDCQEEFEDLKPENNDYEPYGRDNFLKELLNNPQATVAWYELMARHSVFTQNNPWIKENLERMHKVYKLDPKENDTVGTATFLTFNDKHKDNEETCDYTHLELNDEMWVYACWGARMFELTERTGFKQLTSKIRWGLDIDDEYPDLTKPLILDKKEDQTKGYFDVYQVAVNGKTVVSFGMHCSDNGLAEFDTTPPKTTTTTTTTTTKKETDYGLAVVYVEKATGVKVDKDFIWPGRLKVGDPYGPFTKEIAGYTLLSTPDETKGYMPAADTIVTVYYKKNAGTTSDNSGGNPGGNDPDPHKPKGDNPKDDKKSSENQDDNDQGKGDNDNKKSGEQKQEDPGDKQQSSGDNDNANNDNTGNTNHEGNGNDNTPDKGNSNSVSEPSPSGDSGDKKTSDPNKDHSGVVGGF